MKLMNYAVLAMLGVALSLGFNAVMAESFVPEDEHQAQAMEQLVDVYARYGGLPRSEGCMQYRAYISESGEGVGLEMIESEFDNLELAENALRAFAPFVVLPDGSSEATGHLCFSGPDDEEARELEYVLSVEKDGIPNRDWLDGLLQEESSRCTGL
ncbi:MAG: hypothetical protein LAT61_11120 [Alcanivorax sp.]|nr:hypothetical protein [Alcanivorax sp.]